MFSSSFILVLAMRLSDSFFAGFLAFCQNKHQNVRTRIFFSIHTYNSYNKRRGSSYIPRHSSSVTACTQLHYCISRSGIQSSQSSAQRFSLPFRSVVIVTLGARALLTFYFRDVAHKNVVTVCFMCG